MMNVLKRLKSKTTRRSRAGDVLLLLVMFMTYFIVARSVQAQTRVAASSSLAMMHAHGAQENAASKIKINLADEPDAGQSQEPDDEGCVDTFADLDIEFFIPSSITFDFGFAHQARHPRVDLTLTLPSNGFGLEYPPELA